MAKRRAERSVGQGEEYSWREVLPAAALQGAIFALVKAVIHRNGARGFQKLTGTWPGD
jgi:hypothetical protein